MHKKIIILILFISILLTGCWDKVEIEERAHVSAIGIDKYNPATNVQSKEATSEGSINIEEAKDTAKNQLAFTLAYPKNSLEDVEDIIISTVGDTLYSVSRILSNRTNKEIFLGHLRSVVLSADIIKDPNLFREVLDGLETNELVSRRVILAVTKNSASDILNIKSTVEPRIGQFITELFRRKDRSPRVPEGSVGDIFQDLHENGNTVIPRITGGKTDVKVAGSAVIGNYEFKGWLEELETAHLMVLKGEAYIFGGLTVNYKGHSVPIDIRPKKPKMSLIEDEDNIKILIEVEGEGDIKQTYFESNEDLLKVKTIEEIENLFKSNFEEDIENTIGKIQKNFQTDILDIDKFLRQYHYNLWKTVEADWQEIFPNIDIEVRLDIKIRRVGLVR